mmetsp:Transcript_21505/g.28285  ORF Transcript_21505/g.28285 Transcript_21505/m.28285 type:complete len:439 (-) Transcript_21505:277-1593(-)
MDKVIQKVDNAAEHVDLSYEKESALRNEIKPLASANGLFSHQRAEVVLQQLLDANAHNQREISDLKKRYSPSSYDRREDIMKRLSIVEENVEDLLERVDKLEKGVAIPGVSSMTVGEGVSANRRTLARALHLISTKADFDELKATSNSCAQKLDQTFEKLKDEAADISCIEKTNDAIMALTNRVDALSNDLRNKVDNSLFKTISSEANLIRKRSNSIQKAEETFEVLQSTTENHAKVLLDHEKKTKGLSDIVAVLQTQMDKRPTLDGLKKIALEVQKLADGVNKKADKECVEILITRVGDSSGQMNKLKKSNKSLLAGYEQLSIDTTQKMKGVYSKNQVNELVGKFVGKEEISKMFQRWKAEFNARSWNEILEEMQDAIGSLSKEQAIIKKKAELAAQFVGWYGRKGEAYEHNMKAVDVQLSKLARESSIADNKRASL